MKAAEAEKPGHEHQDRTVKIIVNTRPHQWAEKTISYEEVVELAYPGQPVGEGEEVTIELSNGAVVSGTQYIQRALAQHGEAVLVHPLAGPVDAFRTQRIANDKQRAILKAKFRECVWPGCSVPFDDCQIHHIEAWNHGGHTNLQNLVPLCAYHNGLNQDDPLGPAHRGRITLIDGHLAWLSPKTGRPLFLKHNLRPPP